MTSTPDDTDIRICESHLASRRRTRIRRTIASIGFSAVAAVSGGAATGAWLYFLVFFIGIALSAVFVNATGDASDRGDSIGSFVVSFLMGLALPGIAAYLAASEILVEFLTVTAGEP